MTTVADISAWMDKVAPSALSESWDNTGLLLGDSARPVTRVQTCLTLTPQSVEEATTRQADLVIAHHPLPFKPLSKITTDSVPGRLLWQLASNSVAIYAPHTAWDSAPMGINALIAESLGLCDCQAIIPSEQPGLEGLGAGRIGAMRQSCSMNQLVEQLCKAIPYCRPRGVVRDKPDRPINDSAPNEVDSEIRRVAIACGSGGSLLSAAIRQQCDVFVTGEATFHTCLEAEAAGTGLLMVGHFASERFAMERLAANLQRDFSTLEVWASEQERDPVVSFDSHHDCNSPGSS